MPHVSRKKLKRKVFVKIGEQLADIINKTSSPKEIWWFLNELLTTTELIMLSKRLALMFMLKKGYSFSVIQKTLKVTPQTVLRFWYKTRKPSYKTAVEKMSEEKPSKSFWKELEELLFFLPPKHGPGRWKMAERAMSRMERY